MIPPWSKASRRAGGLPVLLFVIGGLIALGIGGLFGMNRCQRPVSFELVGTDGQIVTAADLVGKPTLLYFGYTFCPDICPYEMSKIAQARHKLDPDGTRLRTVFVTVDPERDTPTVLKEFAELFGAGTVPLTGSHEQIGKAARPFSVIYEKGTVDPARPNHYDITHTSKIYFIDANGCWLRTFRSTGIPGKATPEQQKRDLDTMITTIGSHL